MDGVAGLGGWRWIFILQGIFTVVVGLFIPWALPDSIERATFLTDGEKRFLHQRLVQDQDVKGGQGATKEKFQWKHLRECLTDYKMYLATIIFWGNRYVEVLPLTRNSSPIHMVFLLIP